MGELDPIKRIAEDEYQSRVEGRWRLTSARCRRLYADHIGKGYMQQYLNEFHFPYNNRSFTDSQRTELTIKAAEAKRLTMREPKSAPA